MLGDIKLITIGLHLEKPIVTVQIKHKEKFFTHEIESRDNDRAKNCADELKEGISQIISIYRGEQNNGQNQI